MKCKICNFEAKSYKGLGIHLWTLHKLKSETYYNRFMKKEGDGKCLQCGDKTRFLNLGKGFKKYCSLLCEMKHKKLRGKILNE